MTASAAQLPERHPWNRSPCWPESRRPLREDASVRVVAARQDAADRQPLPLRRGRQAA